MAKNPMAIAPIATAIRNCIRRCPGAISVWPSIGRVYSHESPRRAGGSRRVVYREAARTPGGASEGGPRSHLDEDFRDLPALLLQLDLDARLEVLGVVGHLQPLAVGPLDVGVAPGEGDGLLLAVHLDDELVRRVLDDDA